MILAGTAALAHAQTSSTTVPVQVATTPTTTTAGTASTSGGTKSSTADHWIALAILVLGALGILLAYVFYDGWRQSYEKLTSAVLRRTGHFPDTVFDPTVAPAFRAYAVPADQAAAQPVVKGPGAVVVGEPVTFSATVGGQPRSCNWATHPADAASVQPPTGPQTTLTATKAGTLTLTATVAGGQPTVVPLTSGAKSSDGGVPLLGTGFAGVAAALSAFAIAGALSTLGVISGTAFIAFLGPVVGYFFAQARDSTPRGGAGGSAGGGGSG